MKFIYFDGSAGLSGDMILAALLDLGVSRDLFIAKMAELKLPVDIEIFETKKVSLRGLKVDVHVKRQKHIHRKWAEIEKVIFDSPFSSAVKNHALDVFKNLITAEAKVHGHDFFTAHLHEAGADDAIIDIVGCCFLIEELNIKKLYSSPLNVGGGYVKSSHGILPVPPPAVAEILKGIPVYSAHVKEELVTPTGAAIAATLVDKFIINPELTYENIGYGAGGRSFADFPNILRAFYGDIRAMDADKRIYVIEANIDDCEPQILAAFYEKAFKQGALDVFQTPIFMKKNRLATKLSIIADLDKIDFLIETVFAETSSIGVRYFPVNRRILERKFEKVLIMGEEIKIKVAHREGKAVNYRPEFEDCLKVAEKKGVPVKKILELSLRKFSENLEKSMNGNSADTGKE